MHHHDIAYSIMQQRVAGRIAQAAADRLAAEARRTRRSQKLRRSQKPADSPLRPDTPGTLAGDPAASAHDPDPIPSVIMQSIVA
ncbi:hypothetical protein ACRYCC_03315 [Actinomadura scrupuli]|uniref:hypothetical protein n=1 Tax=Actinomadura scrupuli TaxID=559629 RepID=UPI003D986826